MKKAIISGLMAGLLTITPVFADTTAVVAVSPGITPDSVFYVVDQWVEDIQLALNGDPEKKAELLHQISLERLAEAEKMIEENKEEYVNITVEGYVEKLDLIQEVVGELIVSEDISDEIKEALSNQLEALTEVSDETVSVIDTELKIKMEEKIESAYLVANVVKGLDVEKVKTLRAEMKLGYGQIAHVFRLAEAADMSVEEVAELLSQGKGVGQVAKELGLHPSVLKGKKKAMSVEAKIADENVDQEELEDDEESVGTSIVEVTNPEKLKKQIRNTKKDSEKKTVITAVDEKDTMYDDDDDDDKDAEERKVELKRKEEKEKNSKVKESKEVEKKQEAMEKKEKVKPEKPEKLESVVKENNGKKKN